MQAPNTMLFALTNAERASDKQKEIFERCLQQRQEKLLFAEISSMNYLIMHYQIKSGRFIRVKYTYTGELRSKRAYREYDHSTNTPQKEIKFYE
jgi:DNA phosphorothioation-dependent restriction protein DptG